MKAVSSLCCNHVFVGCYVGEEETIISFHLYMSRPITSLALKNYLLNECTKHYVKTGYQKPLETDHKVVEQLFSNSINIDKYVAGIKMFFLNEKRKMYFMFF